MELMTPLLLSSSSASTKHIPLPPTPVSSAERPTPREGTVDGDLTIEVKAIEGGRFPSPVRITLHSLGQKEGEDLISMEPPTWSGQGYYSYYPQDASRTNIPDRQAPSPGGQRDSSMRRVSASAPSPVQYLPTSSGTHPVSPHSMNLPPFSQTFYSPYTSTSSGSQTSPNLSLSHGQVSRSNQANQGSHAAQGMQQALHPTMGYGAHIELSSSSGTTNPYPYPGLSPAPISSAPLLPTSRSTNAHQYQESPRLVPGYSVSPIPASHYLPHSTSTSPSIPLMQGLGASSASASSSSHAGPSAKADSAELPKTVRRRTRSTAPSESWDDVEEKPTRGKKSGKSGKQSEGNDWGMPQDEYKALNPKDKKQVRNRIGARRFRAKRKDYVNTLESNIRGRDEEITSLRSQLDSHHRELDELRQRSGLPTLPPLPPSRIFPSVSGFDHGGLGLSVDGEWDGGEVDGDG